MTKPKQPYQPYFKIEKNIPIPPKNLNGVWRDMIMAMKIGDSFMVSTQGNRDAALTHVKKYNRRVTTRKLPGIGYRIWRVK